MIEREIVDSYETGLDPISERARAYTEMIVRISRIRNSDLRAEGLAMLVTLRESVTNKPRGDLHVIKESRPSLL